MDPGVFTRSISGDSKTTVALADLCALFAGLLQIEPRYMGLEGSLAGTQREISVAYLQMPGMRCGETQGSWAERQEILLGTK
jgi:hypothetical protein